MDPVEHVSHFNQRMAMHSKNEVLICKVFPSSLGPVAMRWFDGLGVSSIDSFKELTRAFRSRFITCRKVPRLLDSLLSMTMREWETLKTYSDKYYEMFNEIDGDFDDVAIRNFKVGLLTEHDLRKSLTKKPVRSMRRLMDHIDEYKRVKEDQQQGKVKAKVILKIGGIFCRTNTIITGPKETLLGNLGLLLLRWSAQCFVSQCIKSWKKLRMSHTLNGQIRWEENL